MKEKLDLILVGGGLFNCLLARRLQTTHPGLNFLLFESGPKLGGNHTWSFHHSDLSAAELQWIHPLITQSWKGYSVAFPQYFRAFPDHPYSSIVSEDLHAKLMDELGEKARLQSFVQKIQMNAVEVNGEVVEAGCILDGRGFFKWVPDVPCGFQKFIGWDLELKAPHGLRSPVIMDARRKQTDGYRFFYLLPFSETRILVEDTYYSDTARIDEETIESAIQEYLFRKKWEIKKILRKEKAALPIPLKTSPKFIAPEAIPAVGVRGNFFHPTTGYSLPDAVHLVHDLSSKANLDLHVVNRTLQKYRKKTHSAQKFYLFLNRLLFQGAEPTERRKIFERFYRMSPSLIRRFYAGQTSPTDRIRILAGKPPIPVKKAVPCLWPSRSLPFRDAPPPKQDGVFPSA